MHNSGNDANQISGIPLAHQTDEIANADRDEREAAFNAEGETDGESDFGVDYSMQKAIVLVL